MASQTFETTRAESFEGKLIDNLNGAALALRISMGHRTRLFDVMSILEPSTSQDIATAAGLHERYVREWLGAMLTGDIVDFDPEAKTYHLPAEHAATLTRSARPNNMAATFQWIPLLAMVEDEVVRCFEEGGGVPYSSFERFHEVMAEESDQTVVAVLLDEILPSVAG